MAFVPKPQFPDVPNLPGVPQLVRASTSVIQSVLPVLNLGLAAARLIAAIQSKPQWGVYRYSPPQPAPAAQVAAEEAALPNDGLEEIDEITVTATALPRVPPRPQLLLSPDSIFRAGYLQEYSLPTAPIQDGGFATYNKVGSPFEIELRMTKGGSRAERAQFLEDCERLGASLDLCQIVTPERTYRPCNLTGISVSREGNQGAYFFAEVDVRFIEIRLVQAQYDTSGQASSLTDNAANPSARPTQNQGVTNAITPPTRVQGLVDKTLAPLRAFADLLEGN